ncbi:MAG: YggS family pyridoxal phosphate enzyme [Chloroflexi bacterium UTCFX4]|jgi:pyridoxal phosphate enzyme (YggS family)|nr:MAG: YggS family pyridoxal phosphate enzyme [Chloroflexi bacterium UTCFX4]
MSIAENLARVREQIETAAQRAGRPLSDITLVAVSKTFPTAAILEAYAAGARDIGENRVEEASEKIPSANAQLAQDKIRWHLIGHLQRRKARAAVTFFDIAQSVDTLRLAEALNRAAAEQKKQLPILLQVNVGNDPNKFGFDLNARAEFLRDIAKIIPLTNLQVQGLMTIGPLVATPEQARPFFRELRKLRDELAQKFPEVNWRELSMGMTDDYAVAIEEGATIVRIGRAIFGQRG